MNSNPLKLTKTDFKEVERAAGLLARIDAGDCVSMNARYCKTSTPNCEA